MINSLGSAAPRAPRRTREAQNKPKNTMSADAGCCDSSPWMSWSWWWEPVFVRPRKRTIEEQEMIEACTTPRKGRTSFDE